MWVRQCELRSAYLPIPSRIVSNEEFLPPEPTSKQIEYEARLRALAEHHAKRRGISESEYLRNPCGMAAALFAMNMVFGKYYDVAPAELEDPQACAERVPRDQFIFDVQTHHVDVRRKWYDDTPDGKKIQMFFRLLRSGGSIDESLEQLNRAHYVKEVFGDSDTDVAVISGVPTRDWSKNPLPPDQMADTRRFVNELAGSRRVLAHGLLRPNLGSAEFEEMERQVRDLKIEAWKMYTGAEIGEQAWFMDDEKTAYPFWERTQKLGVRNLCVHKGLPLGLFHEKACMPLDLEKAALDWPGLNFIVYHSGFRGWGMLAGGTGPKVVDPRSDDPQEIPWISDLLRILKRNPKIRNIWFELGSTFHQMTLRDPTLCLHMLGQMLLIAGPERILWGTDSIWNGSPQSQIERFRRLEMTPELMERFGYPPLDDGVKRRILGLNAAELYGLDAEAVLREVRVDRLAKMREEYRAHPDPSHTQFGWVWLDDDQPPTVPVGT